MRFFVCTRPYCTSFLLAQNAKQTVNFSPAHYCMSGTLPHPHAAAALGFCSPHKEPTSRRRRRHRCRHLRQPPFPQGDRGQGRKAPVAPELRSSAASSQRRRLLGSSDRRPAPPTSSRRGRLFFCLSSEGSIVSFLDRLLYSPLFLFLLRSPTAYLTNLKSEPLTRARRHRPDIEILPLRPSCSFVDLLPNDGDKDGFNLHRG
jgi:hypothetical protein